MFIIIIFDYGLQGKTSTNNPDTNWHAQFPPRETSAINAMGSHLAEGEVVHPVEEDGGPLERHHHLPGRPHHIARRQGASD